MRWTPEEFTAYENKRLSERRESLDRHGYPTEAVAAQVASKAAKPSKYHNQFTVVDGIKFASKWEAEYYGQLKLRVRAGEITGLTVHHAFDLAVQGVHITRYIADFVFFERGIRCVHDTKGASKGGAYDLFRVKKKLMLAVFGIEVVEVRRNAK